MQAHAEVELGVAPPVALPAPKKPRSVPKPKGPKRFRGPYANSLDAYAPLDSGPDLSSRLQSVAEADLDDLKGEGLLDRS